MSMGTLGTMMRKTRTAMIEETVDSTAREFWKRFGLQDGDYIEFERPHHKEGRCLRTIGRIVMVEDCFFNQRGGYTASVKVAPLLIGGRLGNTRSVMMTINANGGKIRQLGGRDDLIRKINNKDS